MKLKKETTKCPACGKTISIPQNIPEGKTRHIMKCPMCQQTIQIWIEWVPE